MGKTISKEPGLFGQDRAIEDYDDGPDEWDAEDAMDDDATEIE